MRAALSLGISVTAVWAAVNLSAGLITIIGAFSAVYVSDRPYRYRGIVLCGIALALATAACLGAWTRSHPMLIIPVVASVAITTTFLSHALRIGPPGAYMFALACAVGTALPASQFGLWQIALFVLFGGATSWLIQMLGFFGDPRGPETAAVVASARAVAAFANASRGSGAERARDDAARALHDGWIVLVSLQPITAHADERLTYLRMLNRELHMLFAACVNATDRPEREDIVLIATRALGIAESARHATTAKAGGELPPLPLGHLDLRTSIRENLRLRSPALETAMRVGFAVIIAGGAGALFGLQRTYWAMAAAVLVLHEGAGWKRVAQRGMERMAGTLAGLGLVAVVLALHPGSAQLVGMLVVLQFVTEMLVTRNYALAAVFITSIALLVGTGGHAGAETGRLLWTRGQETIVGCVTGLLVYVLTASRRAHSVRAELVSTIEAIGVLIEGLAHGEFSTPRALIIRRDVQRSLLSLVTRLETQLEGPTGRNGAAARLWPAVAATERLGYKVLATCWSLEAPAARNDDRQLSALPIPADLAVINSTLVRLAESFSGGAPAPVLPDLPPFFRTEIVALYSALVPAAAHSGSMT